MAEVQTKAYEAILHGVVEQIVSGFSPQKIILFGSYAYGEPREDSDFDLLIVAHAQGRPLRLAADIAAAIDHPVPLDILVFEPGQLQKALNQEMSFATEVVSRGKVLYEAGDNEHSKCSHR